MKAAELLAKGDGILITINNKMVLVCKEKVLNCKEDPLLCKDKRDFYYKIE